MKEKYILYLIPNKSGKLLKIGKTKESFKTKRYKKIDDDFGARFKESFYVESISQDEVDNLERILHKVFYMERKAFYYKTGVGKTEWFNRSVQKDVIKHINHLRKHKNFKNLSPIKAKIELESKFTYIKWKLLFVLCIIFYILLWGFEKWFYQVVNKSF